MDALLALLTAILGEDHALVVALSDAEPTTDVVYDGATEDELASIAAFGNIDDDTINQVMSALRDAAKDDSVDTDTITQAADAYRGLSYIQDVRAEAAELEAAAREEALAAFDTDDDDGTSDDADAETPAADDSAADDEFAGAETVTASRPRIGNVAPRVPKPIAPIPATVEQIAASADKIALRLVDGIGGQFARGQEADLDTLVQALPSKYAQFGGKPSGYEQHTVASASWIDRYPAEQRLGRDAGTNDAVIQAAVGNLSTIGAADGALTAAICAPPEPVYDIPTLGTEERPVKDFLPSFGATRGGIVYRRGLSLTGAGTIGANSSGVTANWIDGDANKFVLAVACPSTVTTSVEAFVARAEVSNMQGQFDPESVAAALRLQMVLWARGAETSLLDTIDANSSPIGADNSTVIGFGRLLLQRFNILATTLRSRQRMAKDATLDLMLPSWVINAYQDDISWESPGDGLETQEQAAADLERRLAARNIRVGWFLDQQLMQTQEASVPALAGYPQQVTGYMFEPGAHLFLDGGELNLGIVRDSTLNNTNEYQTFMETFEAVAYRGVESWSLEINVCPSGSTSAPTAISCAEAS